jgi:inhibitor of cysteine peptidase
LELEERKMSVNKTLASLIIVLVLIIGTIGYLVLQNQGIVPIIVITGIEPPVDINVKTFNSIEEIRNFILENAEEYSFGYGGLEVASAVSSFNGASASKAENVRADDFSATNIQVGGVDEPDIVKNDGKYIYTVSGKKVVIVDAYPAGEMKIVSEIVENQNVRNIFINKDKLIVFAEKGDYIEKECPLLEGDGVRAQAIYPRKCGYYQQEALVRIYDVSDRTNPKLWNEISVDGNYVEARMIDEYVYLISSEYIQPDYFDLPSYRVNGIESIANAGDISYFDFQDSGYNFNTITAINVKSWRVNSEVYLMGSVGMIYVSEDNIYLTYMKRYTSKYQLERYVEEVVLKILPEGEGKEIREIIESDKKSWEKRKEISEVVSEYVESLGVGDSGSFSREFRDLLKEFNLKIQKEMEKSVVHRIEISELDVDYEAVGEVPGSVLNQFSMDEHEGNLRIATTIGHVSRTGDATSLNNLYVMDKDLEIIGKVEDIAPGERIYSTRFIEDRAYMVTFKKVDPLFVIDVSNPEKPEILGYLKITGYSDYLHPYDENHIIGIGKETIEAETGDFAWYQGLKISLFDVSDVGNPREVAKIEIGDRGTDSYALYDHKAFLFDKKRNLLVIPVSLSEIDETQYEGREIPDNANGERVWQGAFVLNIDTSEISERGRITHYDEGDYLKRWYYGGEKAIQRSLYMDNVLYTLSLGKIKANDLLDLKEISEVNLDLEERDEPIYY